ncbi:MAG: acetate--CoA ligase [Alphaproteobacteria bacterium]|nr:acetate--CoA ligase [Alphaproteobacteria bacterium]
MSPKSCFNPHISFQEKAHLKADDYKKKYDDSVQDPDAFWAKEAARIDWVKPFSKVKNTSFEDPVSIKWYEDGTLNVAYNCLDRHLQNCPDKIAIIWEGDDPKISRSITYRELYHHTCRFANVLKDLGVQKGDRVVLYMPMIPETAFAMLACARIGAVHSVVFGGFSPEALKGRIHDCMPKVVITADEGLRGGKHIPLKVNVDKALEGNEDVEKVLVVKRTGTPVAWHEDRDLWVHELLEKASSEAPCAEMNAEDPLFILYTSGSTGTPKGVLHTSGGYLVYAAMTHHYVFDHQEDDIFFCTADLGWVTGHSYVLYGPLCNGATTIMFEGIPTYPDASRFWQIIDKHKVSLFYTAPTAIRALMREGDAFVQKTKRSSLRVLGSVGEPINPEAWLWYHEIVGEGRCPIVDTWWQTETGGILISPIPGAISTKPGSATLPFFGIKPEIVDVQGNVLDGAAEGALCIADSWPGQMRSLYKNHKRFVESYFSTFKGKYFTGDGARRDEDGYYWITGRIDDVINVSGHRLGTAEIESALVNHQSVAEAAVVGYPHDIKGQGIYAYVILKTPFVGSVALRQELIQMVRTQIGPIATPDLLQFVPNLPKTRSGKIMRRLLRKIAAFDLSDLGDTSTLSDPQIIDILIADRSKVA